MYTELLVEIQKICSVSSAFWDGDDKMVICHVDTSVGAIEVHLIVEPDQAYAYVHGSFTTDADRNEAYHHVFAITTRVVDTLGKPCEITEV